MAVVIPAFGSGSVEEISRAIGALFSGSQLTQIFVDCRLDKHDPGTGATKWKRIASVLDKQQASQGDGRPVIRFISTAMQPDRLLGASGNVANCKDRLNTVLAISGFRVLNDGRIGKVKKASTLEEALQRSRQLRGRLEKRGAHAEVLRQCRPELLEEDYYEAVFEAIKGLGDRLRKLGGKDEDGRPLVQSLLGGKSPKLPINDGGSVTKRNEQVGIALFAEGLFAAFRNPAAHEPRLEWDLTEQDALDVLGVVSLVHRRLDLAEQYGASSKANAF
ncbi:TIGR02391 family protein [Corynebacterium haemomassiliense]|uniref:TIGR02391 family protein n=1 Tax=Corynebacterium haemomassiliense TaxID=2754726 RepID=UPI002889A598|nr:TIGR02391 family protein [Corynebacterium haemomassiliense]